MPLDQSGFRPYPKTMALDLGSYIGYAVGVHPSKLTWGDFPLASSPERLESAPAGEKAATFAWGLNELLVKHEPEALVVEAAFFGSKTNYEAGEQQIGLFWQAKAAAWVASIRFNKHHAVKARADMGIHVPRGEDPKPLVMNYVRSLGIKKFDSDHQADAILLWLYHWCLHTETSFDKLKRMLVTA